MKKLITYIAFALLLPCKQLLAQTTAYIYVHQSTVDESSNPTTGGFSYSATTSTVGALPLSGTTFTLNDLPTTPYSNSTFGVSGTTDVGAASTGTLFAGTSSGLYYRTVNSSTWNLAAGTTSQGTITRVDGGFYDMAVYATSSGLYLFSNGLTTVKTLVTSGNIVDVAYDRVNGYVLYTDNTKQMYYAKVTPTVVAGLVTLVTVGSFTSVSSSYNNCYRLDVDYQGNIFYMDSSGDPYIVKNYTNSSTRTRTSYTKLSGINTNQAYDVGCADDGSYYMALVTSTFGVFEFTPSTNTFVVEPTSGITFNITGGPAGQMWSNYYTNQIWTRAANPSNTTTPANWIDDERPRTSTTLPGNAEMIAVTIPAGQTSATYVITQTAVPNNTSGTALWNLQKISIYDSSNPTSQTSSVTNSTATITVTAGEIVHVVYQDYYLVTTAFNNNCGTSSFLENFGTGTSGSLAPLTSAEIGATSYHWYGTTAGTINDGYYASCVNSTDVGYGSSNGVPSTLDHTASSTAAGGLAGATGGNFLFVNASFQTDVFYQREFTGLIPGNPYTITYYIANITGASTVGGTTNLIPVNVTAQVTDPTSGAVLSGGTQTSGNITAVGKWTKESFTFTPGTSQTTANFSLINNQIGGNGNDIGLDDISFVLQPSVSVTASVSNTCNGTSTITVTSPLNTGSLSYQYSLDGVTYQTSPVFTGIAQNNTYTVYATYVGSTGCASSVTLVPANKHYTWSGLGGNTALTTAGNWVGGAAPTLTDENSSIEIPVVSNGNYPVLSANASIFSLQVDGAPAYLNLNGYTLNVGCDIYNATTVPTGSGLTAGTYPVGGVITSGTDVSTSTINWNGSSSAQKYVGNSTAGTFKMANMTINNTYNNGAGVITMSAGPMDIYNVLTLTEGNLVIPTAASVANTQLTLKSTSTQTAALAQIVSPNPGTVSVPTITGSTINVERYITGNGVANSGYRGYRMMASPVYVATASGVNYGALKYINTTVGSNYGALIGGPGTVGTSGFDVKNPNPTIYLYGENFTSNNTTYISGANVGISTMGTSPTNYLFTVTEGIGSGITFTNNVGIPVGNGYIFYYIGSINPLYGLATASTRICDATTITATGTLNTGTIPVTVWNTKTTTLSNSITGYNQMGNPYACAIDLNKVYSDNYNASTNPIGAFFYEMNIPGQAYISYQAVSPYATQTSHVTQYIQSGQGFLMQASVIPRPTPVPATKLTFYEDQKVPTVQLTAGSTSLMSLKNADSLSFASTTRELSLASTTKELSLAPTPVSNYGYLHLKLSADTNTFTETGLYFSSGWTDKFDGNEDAPDLDGPSPKVYLSSFTSDGTRVGINEMGDYIKTKRVKLFVGAKVTATYQLELSDIKNIDPLYNVFIVDKLLKDSVDLRTTNSYSFTITATDTTTFGANRFELAVEPKALPPYKLISFTGAKDNAGIQLQWKTANEGNFTGFTLQKLSGTQWVGIDSLQSNSSGAYSYTDVKPSLGLNSYRLMQNGITGNITYSSVVVVDYTTLSTNGVLSVFPNPTRSDLNIYVNLPASTYNLRIYNSFGGVMKQQSLSGTNWVEDVNSYNAGTYVVEVIDNKGGLVGKLKFVKLK